MNDLVYIGIIAVMFLIFIVLHVKQNKKISRLMKRYEKFMKGKNAENLADALEENFQQMDKLEISHQKTELKMETALRGIYI